MKVDINLWHKIRGKPLEQEESIVQSDTQSSDQSSNESNDEPNVIIIRNTRHAVPNISHNRYKNTGRAELYAAAGIGILVQISVILYCGIITQFSRAASKFQKDGNPVGSYAFPLTLIGTVVLSFGMLICCRVVETSTKEITFRPTKNWRARMVWLQQKKTVGDQEFKSFALFTGEDQPIITTSGRKAPRERPENPNTAQHQHQQQQHTNRTNHHKSLELMTVIGATTSLVGFFAQFIGIRGMHWSASIASLMAVLIMTAVRAWVRRGLAKPMYSEPLRPGFEIDWFADTLKNIPDAPWYKKKNGNTPADQKKPIAPDASAPMPQNSNISEAQQCIERRQKLAKLAGCQGPVSKEAIAVTLAIESTMNLLDGKLGQEKLSWNYNIQDSSSSGNKEKSEGWFQLDVKKQNDGKWKANAGEIEAALSLRLFYDESQQMTQSLARVIHKSGNPPNDDTWLRLKGEFPDTGVRILGPNTLRLLRHLDWWIPADGPQIWKGDAGYIPPEDSGKHHRDEIGNFFTGSTTFEVDESRVVGLDPQAFSSQVVGAKESGIATSSHLHLPFPYYRKPQRGKWKFGLSNEESKPLVYIKSQDPLNVLYAKDMFSTFMGTVVESLNGLIEGKTDVQTSQAILNKEEDSWRHLVLRNDGISRFALAIQSSGLFNVHEAYISVILPLCMKQKLPELDGIIELVRNQTRELEARHLWKDAGEIYLQLSYHLDTFGVKSRTYIRAIAVLVAFRNALQKANPDVDIAQKLMENADKELEQNLDSLCEFRDVDIDFDFDPAHERLFRLAEKYKNLGIDHSVPREHEAELEEEGKTKDIFDRTPLHFCAVFIYRTKSGPEITGNAEFTEDKTSSERYLQHTQKLVDNGADINGCDIRGWTPLHYACHIGKTSIHVARLLLERGADANVRGRDGTAPIHCAVTEGHLEIVKLLLEFEANIDVLDGSGSTALHAAVLKGSAEIFKLLCARSRKIRDKQGRTAFHTAAMAGFSDAIECWASDVNLKDNAGKTPLYLAVESGHKEFVQQLLKFSQVEIDAANGNEKHTALHIACLKKYGDIAKSLIDKGADINAMDGKYRTPLLDAVCNEDESMVELLTAKGADVKTMNRWGQTTLHFAVMMENVALFKHLVSAKEADVNVGAGTEAGTPLHQASVVANDNKWIQDLIDLGADVDAVDNEDKTPLHYAAHRGCAANIQRLIEAKANKEARDRKRCTPLLSATENYNKHEAKDCLRLLIELGADVKAANESGRTTLHEVAVNENLAELIPDLLCAGAKIEQTDTGGSTALHRAVVTRCAAGIKMLMTCGANVEVLKTKEDTARLIASNWWKKNIQPFMERSNMRPVET